MEEKIKALLVDPLNEDGTKKNAKQFITEVLHTDSNEVLAVLKDVPQFGMQKEAYNVVRRSLMHTKKLSDDMGKEYFPLKMLHTIHEQILNIFFNVTFNEDTTEEQRGILLIETIRMHKNAEQLIELLEKAKIIG